jgi:ubiquinone/menaquinone biosynthesis C-methylase UbiE
LPGDDIVGLDISMGMLSKARSRMSRLVRGHSQRLPFADETFDVVFCRSLLHHLPDPSQGVYEIDRVLKKNGELVVSEPIESILSSIPRKLVKGGRHFSDVHKDFKQRALVEMLQQRFTIVAVKNFGYLAYPVLGFPDIVDPLGHLPFRKAIAALLLKVDIRTQSYGIIVKTSKRD